MLTKAILSMFETRPIGGTFTVAAFVRELKRDTNYRLQEETAVTVLEQVSKALARDGVNLRVYTTMHGTYVSLSK